MSEGFDTKICGKIRAAGAVFPLPNVWARRDRQLTEEIDMREFWVTVGAMVLGYVMYIIVKSISKK